MHKRPKLRLLLKLLQILLFIAAWQRSLTEIETNRKLTTTMADVANSLRANTAVRRQTLAVAERIERDRMRTAATQHPGHGAMKQPW